MENPKQQPSPNQPPQKRVQIKINDNTYQVASGTPIQKILPEAYDEHGHRYLGAILNSRLVGLNEQVWGNGLCQGVTLIDGRAGASIYRRSAILILYEATRELYPSTQLEIGQSLGNGYHFLVHGPAAQDPDYVERLMERSREIIEQDRPFEHQVMTIDEATAIFEAEGSDDKVLLLRIWPTDLVHIITLGTYHNILYGPVAPSTGYIEPFYIESFPPGFVLQFQSSVRIGFGIAPQRQQKLFQSYQETREWNRILGVNTVGQLNELCLNGGFRDLIRISEGFHEKKIAQIADQIVDQGGVKLILIAGPSSSGKTTFAKRLGIQLRVNGIQPVAISLDDYYVDRDQTPRHPDGRYNFEAVEALDLELFNEHLRLLLQGQTIQQPVFDFERGCRKRESAWRPLTLQDSEVLLLEGIHALNPCISETIPDHRKFKIFINALTQLIVDRSNRLFTSEIRLLRRIVRDRRYRGYLAAETFQTWPSVRNGERQYIFPFQEEAHLLFNSALVYEPAVLKIFAELYLLEIKREDPSSFYAHHLRNFLRLFVPILPNEVPKNSILREFIGDGSSLPEGPH